jgi:hypothetical protein
LVYLLKQPPVFSVFQPGTSANAPAERFPTDRVEARISSSDDGATTARLSLTPGDTYETNAEFRVAQGGTARLQPAQAGASRLSSGFVPSWLSVNILGEVPG